jgi:hypothetical protein
MVLSRVARLMEEVDVVVLAQASMARIQPQIPTGGKARVLASPRLAMIRASDTLAAIE